MAILVARAGRKIESISLRSFFKPKQLQKVKNECFHTQYVHTAKSAIRDAEVAIAAHSIHQPNQNIKIGSSIILTPQAISVGIILILRLILNEALKPYTFIKVEMGRLKLLS